MKDKGVCKTAPATPGLLNIDQDVKFSFAVHVLPSVVMFL